MANETPQPFGKKETPPTPEQPTKQPGDAVGHDTIPNTLNDPQQPTSHYGPLIGIAIVIVLLLLAGLYFFEQRLEQRTPGTAPPATTTVDVQTQQLEQQSASDEIPAIEEDLENTSLENIDQELNQIEQELQAE